MKHPFDYLELSTGSLIFTPCPGTKGVSLSESISQLKTASAAAIITLMPTHVLVNPNWTLLVENSQTLQVTDRY